jgi:hypothetical protein
LCDGDAPVDPPWLGNPIDDDEDDGDDTPDDTGI